MTEQKIIIYGTNWCSDCHRAQRFLKLNHQDFVFINIDKDRNAEQFVLKSNLGMRSVPTILFPDGSILVEPNDDQLAKKLRLSHAD